MGKKSKKNATKAKGNAPTASSEVGGAGIQGETGLAATSGSGSKKKLKCVRCFGNIKYTAKACQCPGCSLLYCWRCEKKAFQECPNNASCICPMRRCCDCAEGNTAALAMVDAGTFEVTRDRSVIQEYVRSAIQHKKELSRYAFPFVYCGGNGCHYVECFECVSDSSKDEMLCCTKCKDFRCSHCSNAMLQGLDSGDARDELFSRIAAGEAGVVEYGDYLLRSIPRVMLSCESCREPLCFGCMSESELKAATLSDIYHFPGENGNKSEMPYKCSRCYWAGKSCTNPNCPKEVGIPTKRCSGCHLDRYCSVKCQAAMYPEHSTRCQVIQAKRAAAGKVDGGSGHHRLNDVKHEAILMHLAQNSLKEEGK